MFFIAQNLKRDHKVHPFDERNIVREYILQRKQTII